MAQAKSKPKAPPVSKPAAMRRMGQMMNAVPAAKAKAKRK